MESAGRSDIEIVCVCASLERPKPAESSTDEGETFKSGDAPVQTLLLGLVPGDQPEETLQPEVCLRSVVLAQVVKKLNGSAALYDRAVGVQLHTSETSVERVKVMCSE